MPVQKTQSLLMQKFGKRLIEAHENHKNDEVTYGQMELPPIDNGIAQLWSAEIKTVEEGKNKKNEGEPYFYAVGIVHEPKEVGGLPVAGQRTQIMEMLCDTQRTNGQEVSIDEHLGNVYQHLRRLGVDTSVIDPENDIGFELEKLCQALTEVKPFFRFRTWRGKEEEIVQEGGKWWVRTKGAKIGGKCYSYESAAKASHPYAGTTPRTVHEWNGQVAYSPVGAEAGVVVKEPSETKPSKNGKTQEISKTTNRMPDVKESKADDNADGLMDEETTLPAMTDEELVDMATAEDEDAQQLLTERALAAGASQDVVDKAKSWSEVLALSATPEELTIEDDEDDGIPKVGTLWRYKPLDPKTKRPVKKAIVVDILRVDLKTKSVDCRTLDQKTTYKGVSFHALERE
jgi:hypothetical protein